MLKKLIADMNFHETIKNNTYRMLKDCQMYRSPECIAKAEAIFKCAMADYMSAKDAVRRYENK